MAIQRSILFCYQLILIYGSVRTLVNTEQKKSDNGHAYKQSVIEYRWSAWSNYTSCSRSCGTGIKYRHRDCYSIGKNTRKVSANKCTGQTKDYSTCNRQACPENAVDFRDLQCSFFDGRDSGGFVAKWKGFTLPETNTKDCALICSTANITKQFSETVVDGTLCRGSDVCVDGKCRSIGCDGILDSNITRDKCGICNGNNSTCSDISGRVRQQVAKGYTELLVLPKGSRYILVSEKPRSRVILAMKDREGIFFFSVQSVNNVTMASSIVAGTVFRYIKNNQSGNVIEIIKAKGPINESVTIMGFSRQEKATVALWYSYTTSSSETETDATTTTIDPYYPWQTLLHNNILQTISFKKQTKKTDSSNRTVSEQNGKGKPKLTIKNNPKEKRIAKTKLENKQGTTRKYVPDVQKLKTPRKSIQHKKSNKNPKTKTTKTPNIIPTTNKPETQSTPMTTKMKKTKKGTPKLDKKKSSKKINKQKVNTGKSSLKRTIQINHKPRFINSTNNGDKDEQHSLPELEKKDKDIDKQELSIKVATKTKPESLTKIDMRKKPLKPGELQFEWRGNKITPCSTTCKPGVSVTFFSCFRISTDQSVDDLFCDIDDKPNLSYHVCSRHACPPRWVAGEWGSCSLTCGEGVQQRQVKCWQILAPGFDSSVHDYLCPNDTKPQQVRKCKAILPCGPVWEMSEWGKCSVDCGYGWQVRHVRCNSHIEGDCSLPRPIEKQACIQKPCLNYWYTATWSECSGSCGVKHRKIFCRNKSGHVIDEGLCDINKKPLSVNLCGLGRCKHVWIPQEWRRCPVDCGDGTSTRKIICGSVTDGHFKEEPDTYCHHMPRPPDKTSCSANPCGPQWYTTEWGECSKTCGDNAKKMREVKCYHDYQISENCFTESQPEDTESCVLPPCSRTEDNICIDDKRAGCDFLIKPSICERLYYRQVCCQTCHRYGY